ncbi:PspC domain-containing protein [Bacteroidota bacterium]
MAKQESKRLYRSREDKVIAGVCGGVAEYFNTDPIWIRLAAVVLLFIHGIGLILYILAWVLVPENPNQKIGRRTAIEKTFMDVSNGKKPRNGSMIIGIILLIVGTMFLMDNLFHVDAVIMWAVLLIALGVYMIGRRKNK